MNTFSLRMMALLCTFGVAGAATAGVTVAFVEPNRFTDMPFSPWEKDVVLKDLDQYLVKLGTKYLPAGQELAIEILDVDLAGRIHLGSGRDIRVLTGGADWPMIEVRYTLTAAGKTIASGTQRIADMNYFNSHLHTVGRSRETLYYEKAMLNDWFKAKFGAQAQN